MFQYAYAIKGLCHVQFVHQFSLESRVNKHPKFNESFCHLMKIIQPESKYKSMVLCCEIALVHGNHIGKLYKQNETIAAVSLTKLIEAKKMFPCFYSIDIIPFQLQLTHRFIYVKCQLSFNGY